MCDILFGCVNATQSSEDEPAPPLKKKKKGRDMRSTVCLNQT